jgi:hypothetical protein
MASEQETPDSRTTRPFSEPRFGIHEFQTVSRGTESIHQLWDFHRGVPVDTAYLNEGIKDP